MSTGIPTDAELETIYLGAYAAPRTLPASRAPSAHARGRRAVFNAGMAAATVVPDRERLARLVAGAHCCGSGPDGHDPDVRCYRVADAVIAALSTPESETNR